MKSYLNRLLSGLVLCLFCLFFFIEYSHAAATNQDYCNIPPFIAQSLSPLVMLDVGRDHKLYYQAYNDAADLDGDGKLDIDYTHSIDYYGYFDSNKCYTYDSSAKQFNPVAIATNKFCSSGQWSGNALNWMTMTRMDALKKVLYGGHRSTDTDASTVLQRVYVPNDAHSWGKELTGKLCSNGTAYTTNCSVNGDCDSGYTCQDIQTSGKYLVPFTTATTPTTCTAVAPTSVNPGTVLVARYKHASSKNCNVGNSAGMIASYEPGNLFASTGLVTYVGGFEDASLDPGSDHWGDNYNILATTTFTADATGLWWFAVDGDDDVEVQVGPAGVAGGGTIVAQYLGCHGPSGEPDDHKGSIALTEGVQYTIVARHFEAGGGEGVRVWFKRPPTTNSTTSTTSTTTSTEQLFSTKSGTIAAATAACTALSGVLTGGKTSSGMCTDGKKCICSKTTTTTITTPDTPTCPANTTPLVSGSTYTCTPNDWKYVTSESATTGSTTGLYAPLTLFAPDIVSGNECAIMSTGFISDGIPQVGVSVTSGVSQRHLFCSTTAGSATPTDEPILRVLTNRQERVWAWSSKERPVCDTSLGTPMDYSVKVKVCDSSLPETNCKTYGTSLKPTGLLHKYGEGDGTKVCSKNLSKTCTTDMDVSSDCATGEGLCVYKSPMFFGMMSGSYANNTQGGVLRKNVTSIQEEIDPADGTFTGTAGIIATFDKFRISTFTSGTYSCGWVTNGPITNGQCNDWGNPMGEILYETLRYFTGKGTANSDYTYATTTSLIDNTLGLPKPTWGFTKDSTAYQPYDIYPACSRPFALILSDINSSYDADQLPGSAFNTYPEDVLTPQLNLGTAPSTASALSTYNSTSLLRAITNLIGTTEDMNSNDWFVGQSNSSNSNSVCSAKTITDLSLVKGLCPEEPTKLGSYYLPAIAYYGKTQLKANTGITNMDTYAVALASPVADLKVKVGGNYVTIAPTAKSVSGSLSVYTNCANKLTFPAYDVTGTSPSFYGKGLVIPSSTTAFCPTNQIVNFFVDDIRYDGTDVIYANFRINYEDVEQGADHDMDAIVKYEICTATARANNYGTCGNSSTTPYLGSSQFQIKMNSEYAAGGVDQVIGFTLSGTGSTTTDGTYLLIKDADVSGADGDTPAIVADMPLYASRIFTAAGTASGFLKNPLWYAAKWGGFADGNSNKIPDATSEWAKGDGVNPDNYYLVVNPLKLEQQLDKALTDILKVTSSGTAASILNNSEGSGANLLQAVFYPVKQFSESTEASWIGEVQNLWYFIDPFLNKTSIREDTNQDNILNLKEDYVTKFYFDAAQSKTLVQRFADNNGDGLADSSTPLDTVSPDDVKSLWKAGRQLWERNLSTSPRTIYTHTGNSSFDDGTSAFSAFTSSNGLKDNATFRAYLQVADATEAGKLMDYVHGTDQAGYRSRKVTINGCGLADCTREWKLGDIVSSTPKLVSNVKLNTYDLDAPYGYGDVSYKTFTKSSIYQNRGMVLVGANDGMLHAFKLGTMKTLEELYSKAQMNNESGTLASAADNLGKEMWSFIPKNALPYLRYLTCKDGGGDATYCGNGEYNHIFLVDKTPTIIDASIVIPTDTASCTTATDYSTCDKIADGSTWTTVMIGGMGLGGASRRSDDTCIAGASGACIKTPIATTAYDGLSSYFALDVKDPANPKYMWEFNGDPANSNFLGASTSGPAIVRIKSSGGAAKNGKWFAVFASGPTGPIDTVTHQFMGTSSQNLKLFVVDLKSGALLKTIDTGIANAFAGTLSSAVIDTDRSKTSSSGFYSDDVVYVGYTSKDTTLNTWTKGGVIRLVTKDDPNPDNWVVSTVINNSGPVTTTVTKLQDRSNSTLWLYFGTGRFFYKNDDPATSVHQKLYGVKEPCYSTGNRQDHTPKLSIAGGTSNDIDPVCTDAVTETLIDQSGDVSTAPASTLAAKAPGWSINLDAADSVSLMERVITDPVALSNGTVYFTTFKPSADICKFGGESLIWAVRYNTGGNPSSATMQGTALMQVSTGAFAEVKLSTAFENPGNLRLDGRRLADPIQGVPPTAQGLSLITNPKPVKKFLHVREK